MVKDGDTLLIIVENEFVRDWLEMNYTTLIKETFSELTKEVPEIKLTCVGKKGKISLPFDRVADILNDINNLSPKERERLFDILRKKGLNDKV
ncbi:DnaA N-terminal domain-containing protein [Oceanobacillus arenosus]|uniref:DnaA N-terminal domain-containing protein n=1 Tax=Oceanobacillus arenosus TaxID=1229153 RepID=UPI002482BD76|nr:DnaA N-terminal domain-containing protein [Oceanobacillus arenosus]